MFMCLYAVGLEIQERPPGAVEVLARKKGPVYSQQGDNSRLRTSSDNVPSSKVVVSSNDRKRRHVSSKECLVIIGDNIL